METAEPSAMNEMEVRTPEIELNDFLKKTLQPKVKIVMVKSHANSNEKKSQFGNKQPHMKGGACFRRGYLEKRCIPIEKR